MYQMIMAYLTDLANNENVSMIAYYDEEELQYTTYRNGLSEVQLFIPEDFLGFTTAAANTSMDYQLSSTKIKKISEIL